MVTSQNRPGIFARFDVLSFIAVVIEKVITNWASIASYISGGTLMGYLAYLQEVAPLYWGGAFFAGLLFVAIIRAVARWGRQQEAQARLFDATAVNPPEFNRLENEFVRKKISIRDLIHPLGLPITGKTFIECELHGPGLLLGSDCVFDGFIAGNVDLVRLRSNRSTRSPNKALVAQCHFRRCQFYNLALGMSSESVDQLQEILREKRLSVLGE